MKRKVTLLAALIGTLTAGYALGQNAAQPDDAAAFQSELDSALNSFRLGEGKETVTGAEKNATSIDKAVGNSKFTRLMTKDAVAGTYTREDPYAGVRLQALQIAQNQRIIELLERLNEKR